MINNICGTGMHGGKIYLLCEKLPHAIPRQVRAEKIHGADDGELREIIKDYCRYFKEMNAERLTDADYFLLTPDTDNPYKRMYTDN